MNPAFSFRRFRLGICLGLLILFLPACQYVDIFSKDKVETQTEIQEEFKLEKKIGVLTLLENTDAASRATHRFVTEDRSAFYVRSGSVNLRKYEKRKVEIEGRFAVTDSVFEVENATRLGKEDDLREKYLHHRLGVSLLIIPTWEITEKENGIILTPYKVSEDELVDSISITKLSNEKKLGIREWLDLDEKYISKDPGDDSFYVEAVIGPDQLPGIKRTSRDGRRIDFFIVRDDSTYRITHTTIEDEDEDKYRNIFFEMVNNFQFIPITDAPATNIIGAPIGGIEPTEFEVKPPVPEIPETFEAPTSLGASFESRGLGIKLAYPKKWYWEQKDSEILFSDKSLEEGGSVYLKLRKLNYHPGQARFNDPEGFVVSECKEIEKTFYCLFSKEGEFYAKLEETMQLMRDSIELIS